MTYPRETTEYVTIILTDKNTGLTVTSNVELSVVPAGQRPSNWAPAEIVEGKTVYLIRDLNPGMYRVWSRATPPNTEEIPVTDHGTFRVD